MKARICRIGVLFATLAWGPAGARAAEHFEVERMVAIVRHGLSTPAYSEAVMAHSSKTWPAVTGVPGELTRRGHVGMVSWGRYQRERMEKLGLLDIGVCPNAGNLRVYASAKARALKSARAALEGLAPGCGLGVSSAGPESAYFPAETELAPRHPALVEVDAHRSLGMSLEDARRAHQAALQELEEIVGQAPAPEGGSKPMRLSVIPWWIAHGTHGMCVMPLAIADAMMDMFRTQYLEGREMADVAFGYGTTAFLPAELAGLRALHGALTTQGDYLARRRGGRLLRAILETLDDTATREPDGAPRPATSVFYFGHASTIGSVRALIGFDWHLSSGFKNDVLPGGTLSFERWRDGDSGERFVRVSYESPTLRQWRHLIPPGNLDRPDRTSFNAPAGRWVDGVGYLIPLRAFIDAGRARIDQDAVTRRDGAPAGTPG